MLEEKLTDIASPFLPFFVLMIITPLPALDPYNAAAEGVFTKTITIYYNDNQSKVITIKGEVWKTPNASAPENNSINDLKN